MCEVESTGLNETIRKTRLAGSIVNTSELFTDWERMRPSHIGLYFKYVTSAITRLFHEG